MPTISSELQRSLQCTVRHSDQGQRYHAQKKKTAVTIKRAKRKRRPKVNNEAGGKREWLLVWNLANVGLSPEKRRLNQAEANTNLK